MPDVFKSAFLNRFLSAGRANPFDGKPVESDLISLNCRFLAYLKFKISSDF